MTNEEIRAIAADLAHDGATHKLDDGRTLRVTFRPDDLPIGNLRDHGDVWGDTSEYAYNYLNERDTPRPEGFDGNAEKLQVDRGLWRWWQPPADVPRTSEHFATVRQYVRDLLEYGFTGIVLEVLDGEDAYLRPIVRDVASLWGIEPFPDDEYVRSVVTDLLYEVGLGSLAGGEEE